MKVPFIVRVALCLASSLTTGMADVHLPSILSDHMVLQRAEKVPIWGTADPGEAVTVSIDKQTVKTKADPDGRWKAVLNLQELGQGPFTLTVEGKNKLERADVLVGEVWVASGQSNMEFTVARGIGAEEEIAGSANTLLRQFTVKKSATAQPQEDLQGEWIVASPESTGRFTAVGYFFAKKLQSELKVPVALVHTSWGGTPCEAWTSEAGIGSVADLATSGSRARKLIEEAPAMAKAFSEKMEKWVGENGRQDKPVADPLVYAGENVSVEGWVPVQISGTLKGEGLPQTGAVWLRREVEVATPPTGVYPLSISVDGFDSIYWNGKLLKETTYKDFPGRGALRRFGPLDISGTLVKPGKNVLAIRLYEPVAPAVFPGESKAGGIVISGTWMAKGEYEFPPIAPSALASAPAMPPSAPALQNVASFLFNGMVNPITSYAMRGVIWYQGEANAGRAFQYRTTFPLMIADWRKQWARGDFPFYLCQLANYMAKKELPGDSAWAELREAQTLAASGPNCGEAILIDVGEARDIHPRDKKTPGERLAAIALAKDYGKKIPYSGPVFQSMEITGTKVTLTFAHLEGGLVARELPAKYMLQSSANQEADLVRNCPQSELEGFAICGEDKKWVWANAKIEGEKVVVWSDSVAKPIAVRYAWADNPTCNLYNRAGFPAGPFRTDDFPLSTANNKY